MCYLEQLLSVSIDTHTLLKTTQIGRLFIVEPRNRRIPYVPLLVQILEI